MTTDYYYIKVARKSYRFIRIEKRFLDIKDYYNDALTDGHVYDSDGLIPGAIPVSDLHVAELEAKAQDLRTGARGKDKRKASKIRTLRKEEAV